MLLTVGDARRSPYNIQAQLVYCDPPTNRGANEGAAKDQLNDIQYFQFAEDWLHNTVFRMALPGWLVIYCCFNIRHVYETIIRTQFSQLKFHQEIIWHYNFGKYDRKKFVPSHDNILIYRYGKAPFYWEPVAIQSQRQQVGDPRADSRGRTPGSVWAVPRVPGNSSERSYVIGSQRSCQPLKLVTRIILAFTTTGDTVYDPFMGTGTVAAVCRYHKRQYYGLDICPTYVSEARDRLKRLHWDRFINECK